LRRDAFAVEPWRTRGRPTFVEPPRRGNYNPAPCQGPAAGPYSQRSRSPSGVPAARGAINTLAPQTWERDEQGQWRQVDAPPGPGAAGAAQDAARQQEQDDVAPADQTVQNAELDRAESLLAARRARAAREPLIRWVRANPTAPDRDRGLFLLAEMYDQSATSFARSTTSTS
jgi:hypothetical protein